MNVCVAEWTKAIVVFLSGSIPEAELKRFSINIYIRIVVLKHRGVIYLPASSDSESGATASAQTSGNFPCTKVSSRHVWRGR